MMMMVLNGTRHRGMNTHASIVEHTTAVSCCLANLLAYSALSPAWPGATAEPSPALLLAHDGQQLWV